MPSSSARAEAHGPGHTGGEQGGGTVAEDGPRGRCGDRERVRRLEVRLVEAGEHRRRRVEEEVAVDVVLAVGGVGAAVQPLAVMAVGHRRVDLEDVGLRQAGEREPAVGDGCRVDVGSVEGERVHLVGAQVDEGLGAGFAAGEPDGRAGTEVLRPPVEVEIDLHGVDGDAGGAGERLCPGERRHPPPHPDDDGIPPPPPRR